MSHMTAGRVNDPALQQCIQDCLDCHSICLVTASHCLHLGGPHAEAQHLQVLLDCAEVCRTSARFMLRRSDLYDSDLRRLCRGVRVVRPHLCPAGRGSTDAGLC